MEGLFLYPATLLSLAYFCTMSNVILFDPATRDQLLPLVATRPVADMRFGILTLREKWTRYLDATTSTLTQPYLQIKFPLVAHEDNLLINGSIAPTRGLAAAVQALSMGEALWYEQHLVALRTEQQEAAALRTLLTAAPDGKNYTDKLQVICHPWQLFSHNGPAIEQDIQLLDIEPNPDMLSESNTLIGDEIYLEEGAIVEGATLNADTGPIYIGKHAEIMEGCLVRGPFAMGDHAVLKMGAKIYGPTTLGPFCKVGGEVNNAILFGYSNKAHDGFLGNSVLGEWCNLGADTNTSNLKNNYAEVKLWSYPTKRFERTGLQFCGLIMGDHSKCGINTMFNTGTVVGVFANIFGAGFPRNFVPDFAWGGANRMITYQLNKALEVAEKVMARRSMPLTQTDVAILQHLFTETAEHRNF